MNAEHHQDKKEVNVFAAFLLYGASLFGILELFTSASIKGVFTPLMGVDITVYIALFVLAFLIHRGVHVAKFIYLALAIIWYSFLIFYLPSHFGHTLNLFSVTMQVVVTLLALFLLLTP